jgi:cytochrome b pre-mRNA-processing protein 3
MLSFLFRGLTTERQSAAELFAAITAEARRAHWYVEGEVPDTLDGRFAVLVTISALVLVRLERVGDVGNEASVALTERFVEVLESEHRELGLGDPTLGKTIRKLVGMLAKRVEMWRNPSDWIETTRSSLYKGDVEQPAVEHSATALRKLADRVEATSLEQLEQGKFA